jgi:hypothetical protein
MQRHRNDHVVISRFNRQLVAEKFRQRLSDRLIEAVLMPANQRGQASRLVLGGSAVASDRARDAIMRALREASGASLGAALD